MEIWKTIDEGGGKYAVSNKGRVCNNITGKMLKPTAYENGYFSVCIMIGKKPKKIRLHRLVAKYFIPNPNNYPQVNHKDENKTNNDADNLEWCTAQYNESYGTKPQRTGEKLGFRCYMCDMNGNIIMMYRSMNDAAKKNGFDESSIRRACHGEYQQYKGYKWRLAI